MIRILIVDDNEDNLYLLESILDANRYAISSARNGKDALDMAIQDTPDLIISDILMPIMDGYTLCIEFKKNTILKNIPFIFYTATYTNPKDEEFAMHIGATRFLIKPQEPDVFLSIITDVLNDIESGNMNTQKIAHTSETVVLKEYNEALVRKLEDKMLQAEKAESEIRKYATALEREIIERKKIELSLRQSEERFRSFYNDAVVGLYRTSPSGEILLANKTLIQMLGCDSFEEVAKRNLVSSGFVNPKMRLDFIEEIEKNGEVKDLNTTWMNFNNNIIYVRESAKAIRNDAGKTLYYDGIVEDITARKMAEDALEESRLLFQTLAQISPVGIFKTNPDGYTTYVNPKWSELSGLTFDEALGHEWLKAVHPEDREKLNQHWISNATSMQSSEAEYRFVRPDGSVIWVIGNAVPEIVNDKVHGYVGTITDVTELKLSEQKLLTLTYAVEQSPALIVLTDLEGYIKYVNPKFTEVTGYTLQEVINKSPQFLKTEETHPEVVIDLCDTLKRGDTYRGEFRNKKKNGDFYWTSLVASTIHNPKGEPKQFLAIMVDITEKKEVERELILAKEKAEVMNKLKSNLLANLSHELRTPLISVLGYSELIQEEATENLIKDMAKHINKGGNRLLSTLNNLLQFSRVESENIEPILSNININLLLDKIIHSFNVEAEAKGLEIITDFSADPIYADMDNTLISEICSNLLQNAVKFTLKGFIKVSTTIENENIVIKFIDTGIGISEEHQKIIFEEFRQVSEGFARFFEGTGLGLTITKKFVSILGGEISVESKVNEGSVFTLVFPCTKTKKLKTENENEILQGVTAESNSLPNILYVENDDISISVITRFLVDLCNVDSSLDGETAIEKIESKHYDLFLIDINLGRGLNGKDVIRFIRSFPKYKTTPVIALTAYAMHGDREEFIAAGCSDYISKPFRKKELVSLIKSALQKEST